MILDAYWPKKQARKETREERIEKIRQAKLRQIEINEPLSAFDIAARIDGLRRKR